jgi:hypothetical protein
MSIELYGGFYYGFYGALHRRCREVVRTINKGLYYGFYTSRDFCIELYRIP